MTGQAAEKVDAATDLTTSERPLHDYVAEVSERTDVRVGVPLPLGTYDTWRRRQLCFLQPITPRRVRLELFDHPEDATAARVIDLDPARNRTGDVWHVWIKGIRPGQLYAYRVDGPYQPKDGHRFNFNKLLLDPFATAISRLPDLGFRPGPWIRSVWCQRETWSVRRSMMPEPCRNAYSRRSILTGMRTVPPRHPWSKTVIYETHVRGFTIHPSSGVEHPGTYRGLMEKIPYFKELGVTAVELMPVQEFNEHRVHGNQSTNRQTTQELLGL